MDNPETMSEQEAISALTEGWNFVFRQGALIALLPIEEWIAAFDRAEAIGPIVDPTLFRNYLQCGKGPIIKELLAAALTFKRAVQKAQKQVAEDARLHSDFDPSALETASATASAELDQPSEVFIYCPECKVNYVINKQGQDVCEHIAERFRLKWHA